MRKNIVEVENLGVMVLVKGLEEEKESAKVKKLEEYTKLVVEHLSNTFKLGENIPVGIIAEYCPAFIQHAVEELESDINNGVITVAVDNDFDYRDEVFNVITADVDLLLLFDLEKDSVIMRKSSSSIYSELFSKVHAEIAKEESNNNIEEYYTDDDIEIDESKIFSVIVVLGEKVSNLYLDGEFHSEIPNSKIIDTLDMYTDADNDGYLIDPLNSDFNIICKNRLMSQEVYDLKKELLHLYV